MKTFTTDTVTGHCQRGNHDRCDGEVRTGTGWNWFCTCGCHPEPPCTHAAHRPAVEFCRRHRTVETGTTS